MRLQPQCILQWTKTYVLSLHNLWVFDRGRQVQFTVPFLKLQACSNLSRVAAKRESRGFRSQCNSRKSPNMLRKSHWKVIEFYCWISVWTMMHNLRSSVNALSDKAEITHLRTDGQSGDAGWSFLQMARHTAWQIGQARAPPNATIKVCHCISIKW